MKFSEAGAGSVPGARPADGFGLVADLPQVGTENRIQLAKRDRAIEKKPIRMFSMKLSLLYEELDEPLRARDNLGRGVDI